MRALPLSELLRPSTFMEQFPLIQENAWNIMVVFVRTSTIVALMPGFGEMVIPARVKLIVAFMYSIITYSFLDPSDPSTASGLKVFFTEFAIGFTFGVGLRGFVFAIQTAGSIAANVSSLAQLFNSAGEQQQPIMANVLYLAAITLLFVVGTHVTFAEYILASYTAFPIGQHIPVAETSQWGIAHLNESFNLAFRLAAPFVLLSMLYNITIGVINKAMPQLMVVLIGAPFITGASVFLLAISAPFLLSVWLDSINTFMKSPF